jgi:hypothetical protein
MCVLIFKVHKSSKGVDNMKVDNIKVDKYWIRSPKK